MEYIIDFKQIGKFKQKVFHFFFFVLLLISLMKIVALLFISENYGCAIYMLELLEINVFQLHLDHGPFNHCPLMFCLVIDFRASTSDVAKNYNLILCILSSGYAF